MQSKIFKPAGRIRKTEYQITCAHCGKTYCASMSKATYDNILFGRIYWVCVSCRDSGIPDDARRLKLTETPIAS